MGLLVMISNETKGHASCEEPGFCPGKKNGMLLEYLTGVTLTIGLIF